MKILWFTTSPSSAEKKEGKNLITGGWIKSLEKAIKKFHPEVQLGIAFFSDKNTLNFNINGTKYFPIRRKRKIIPIITIATQSITLSVPARGFRVLLTLLTLITLLTLVILI